MTYHKETPKGWRKRDKWGKKGRKMWRQSCRTWSEAWQEREWSGGNVAWAIAQHIPGRTRNWGPDRCRNASSSTAWPWEMYRPRKNKRQRLHQVNLPWHCAFLMEGHPCVVGEPKTQGCNFGAQRHCRLHCPHCQTEIRGTEPGCLHPLFCGSPTQPSPSVDREEAGGASQLLSGNCYYLALQTNLCLTQQTPPPPFPLKQAGGSEKLWHTRMPVFACTGISEVQSHFINHILPTRRHSRNKVMGSKRRSPPSIKYPSERGQNNNKQQEIKNIIIHCSQRVPVTPAKKWIKGLKPLHIYQ